MMEEPFIFNSYGRNLMAIVHRPAASCSSFKKQAVLVVVGGPQTRVGSHRQFVQLSRSLALQGYTVMRFDSRGMGDSDGEGASFIDSVDDIRNAVEVLLQKSPECNSVTIWGLCDAASAMMMYANNAHKAVNQMILLNPWVQNEAGQLQAKLKHYYLKRLTSKDLWKKIFSLGFDYKSLLKDFVTLLKSSITHKVKPSNNTDIPKVAESLAQNSYPGADGKYIDEMLSGLKTFTGQCHFILSGNDITADGFKDLTGGEKQWKAAIKNPKNSIQSIDDADHTFSSKVWKSEVEKLTLDRLA